MSVHINHTVSPTITEEEKEVLQQIHAAVRYPVCRFELRSSREEELRSTALDAVHLTDEKESMESVKHRAELLKSLEEKGLIVLFYHLKTFVKGDYQRYFLSVTAAGRRRFQAGRLPVRLCFCQKRRCSIDHQRKICAQRII